MSAFKPSSVRRAQVEQHSGKGRGINAVLIPRELDKAEPSSTVEHKTAADRKDSDATQEHNVGLDHKDCLEPAKCDVPVLDVGMVIKEHCDNMAEQDQQDKREPAKVETPMTDVTCGTMAEEGQNLEA